MIIKKIATIIIFCNSLQAQISGYIEYDYSVIHVVDYTTKSILEFNSSKSIFTTLSNKKRNDSIPKLISSDGQSETYIINKDSHKKPTVYIDKNNDSLVTKVWKFKKYYNLIENTPSITWEIKSEYKNLGDIPCQKAIGYFRGRTYIVWFTESIPVGFGPWKLQGLPGLILEAKDEQDVFIYRATKIKLSKNVLLEFPDFSDAISLKTFVTEIEPSKIQEINSKAQAKLDRNTTLSSLKLDRESQKEIKYEWEENKIVKKED